MRTRLIAGSLVVIVGASGAAGQPVGGSCRAKPSSYATGGAPRAEFPNDPLFDAQWGLDQINAPEAWDQGARGAGTLVAVIDTGVDLSHPDLKTKLVRGVDLTGDRDCPGPQDEGAAGGHGTSIAGIIAATTDNGLGIAGVAPDAEILPLKVIGPDGTDFADVTAAIRLAADSGADVISLSLGRGDPIESRIPSANQDLAEAVTYAWDAGAVVVAASDNSSFPTCNYPSAAERAICVAASDQRGLPAYYASSPFRTDQGVAVRAPGGSSVGGSLDCESSENVWATALPNQRDCSVTPGYEPVAGSSFAAPHVAGVAALLSGLGLSNEQIFECIRSTSTNQGRYDPVMGYGIVDAAAAVEDCPD